MKLIASSVLLISLSSFSQVDLYGHLNKADGMSYIDLVNKGYSSPLYKKLSMDAYNCKLRILNAVDDMHENRAMKGGNLIESYSVSSERSSQMHSSSSYGFGSKSFFTFLSDNNTKVSHYKIVWSVDYSIAFFDPRVGEYRDAVYQGSIERIYDSECRYIIPTKESQITQKEANLLDNELFRVGNCRVSINNSMSDGMPAEVSKKKYQRRLYHLLKKNLNDSYDIDIENGERIKWSNTWHYLTETGGEGIPSSGQQANFQINKISKNKCEVKLDFTRISAAAPLEDSYSTFAKSCRKAVRKFKKEVIEGNVLKSCLWTKY